MTNLITVNKTTLDRALSEFDEFQSIEIQEYNLNLLGQYIFDAGRIREWTKLFEAEILYKLKKLWQSGTIRPEIISQYKGFHDWAAAQQFTKIKSQSRTAIDNKIRVWESWFSPHATIKPPETVKLPIGKIDDSGNEILKEVPFGTESFTKLLAATAAGKQGKLNKSCWAAITDPNQTVEDLGAAIKASRNGVVKSDSDLPPDDKITTFGGMLRIVENGSYIPFAQWINADDPVASRGRRHVLNMLGLKDEPVVIDVDYSAGIEFDGDGATLNLSGGQTFRLPEDDAYNIYQQLKGFFDEH